MNETPKVEIQSESAQDRAWGKGGDFESGEKFKFTANSVFWVLAPVFLFLPWAIYQRNSELGNARTGSFTIQKDSIKIAPATLEIPEVSPRPPEQKPKPVEVLRTFSSLKIVGVPSRNIPPGSQVKAVLITGASNGLVKAKTTESLMLDGDVLLVSGVTLIGQGQSGEDRLFVAFNRLVWPDGATKQVSAHAYDFSDTVVGLKGSPVRSHALKFAAAASLNFLGGLSEGLQDTQVTGGVPIRSNSIRNAALNGAGKAALDQGKSILESTRNDQNVIEVKASTPLWIVFGGES